MHKIAVFRTLQLGDLLCAMPAIATVKYNYPKSTLYFIGLPHMEPFIKRFDYVDKFVAFPGHPALPEIPCDLVALRDFVTAMRVERFDLLVQLQGKGTIVNDFLGSLGAQRLVGFHPEAADQKPDWMTYPEGLHEVDRHLALMDFLGLKIANRSMHFPLFPQDWQNFEIISQQLSYPFVIVHVGSRDPHRQWPIENFAYLAAYLHDKNYQIILTGVAREQQLVSKIETLLSLPTLNLCGQLDLGQLGCLVQEASLLISNCTGISHIAAALATKSIVISLDGEPERWGPQNKVLHTTFDGRKPICQADIIREINRLLGLQIPEDQNA